MSNDGSGKLPESDPPEWEQVQQIVEFWNRLRVCDETGRTSWEVLEPIERQVTECLVMKPADIQSAWSLTAKAFLLISAQLDL